MAELIGEDFMYSRALLLFGSLCTDNVLELESVAAPTGIDFKSPRAYLRCEHARMRKLYCGNQNLPLAG